LDIGGKNETTRMEVVDDQAQTMERQINNICGYAATKVDDNKMTQIEMQCMLCGLNFKDELYAYMRHKPQICPSCFTGAQGNYLRGIADGRRSQRFRP
jgi:protein-arginine kinase activator protein McsA